MVSEKKVFKVVSHYKSIETLDLWGGECFYPQGVAQVEAFFTSDYLCVMSPFLCIIIMCQFDLIVSL